MNHQLLRPFQSNFHPYNGGPTMLNDSIKNLHNPFLKVGMKNPFAVETKQDLFNKIVNSNNKFNKIKFKRK
jgi:hypothetical protein